MTTHKTTTHTTYVHVQIIPPCPFPLTQSSLTTQLHTWTQPIPTLATPFYPPLPHITTFFIRTCILPYQKHIPPEQHNKKHEPTSHLFTVHPSFPPTSTPYTPFASRYITPTFTTDPGDTFYAWFLCVFGPECWQCRIVNMSLTWPCHTFKWPCHTNLWPCHQ